MLCLFDLDGTLLDTLTDLNASVNAALDAYHLPRRTLAQTRADVGNGVRSLLVRSTPQGEQTMHFEEILDTFRTHYAAHSLDATAPYPGVCTMLETLKAAQHRIGVVSNKFDQATKAICAHFFPGLIDVAIGEAEARGIRKKPHPDAVWEAIAALGGRREDAVYIGDSEVDVMTARNAGLPCISVTWGFRSEETLLDAGARTLIRSVPELTALLLQQGT